MEKKFDPREKERKQTNRKKWYKAVCSLAAAVVVCTVYTLMLPALTLDEESAGDAGVTISESSVPTSEAPAAESSKSDNGSESHNDTAADSSADSSHAATESGPAAAAPSDDRAPSTTNPTTEGEHNAPVTLPTEETNSGAITGSSESHDEVTSPDTDDQEKIKDEENNGNPAADKEETDEEEADNSGSSTDADTEEDDSEKSDDTADVEDASYWETTIPDLSDCETWAEKLLAVAGSQLGYHESILNFRVDNDGNHKGYTRYGEWYGNPYGDWCAMFVSFCLKYAGIDEDIVPQNANCNTWMSDLDDRGLFNDAETYVPEEGDIVFFRQHSKTKADHIGIVKEVQLGTKEVTQHFMSNGKSIESGAMNLLSYLDELGIDSDMSVTPGSEEPVLTTETVEVTVAESITVIEGNSADKVNEVTYSLPDDTVLGFVSMGDAEYVHNGGSLEDKNAALDAPATLEEKIELTSISGPTTVEVGSTITLTGSKNYCNNYYDYHNDTWTSSDTNVATVTPSSNSSTASVKGLSKGTTTITHGYCARTGDWYNGYSYNHNQTETYTITVVEENAQIYYLKQPSGTPGSNDTGQWSPDPSYFKNTSGSYYEGTPNLWAKVNTNGATWVDNNKNIMNPAAYVVSWPDGTTGSTWVMPKNTYIWHYQQIFNAYKEKLQQDLGITLTSVDDIEEITLIPYKISKNNYTNPDKHVDCIISVKCKQAYTARFWVANDDSVDYLTVHTEDHKKGDTINQHSMPPTKVENGKTYYFDGWYPEDSTGTHPAHLNNKISDWPYTPSDNELADGTVNFYARYISECEVNYAIALGSGSLDKPKETYHPTTGTPGGSTPTADEGWIFEGWYFDEACQNPVPTEWIDAATGKITPPKSYEKDGVTVQANGKTYYAKFTSGVALPETGGPGTTLLYLLGAMLITAPLTITFIKRRRKENEEN